MLRTQLRVIPARQPKPRLREGRWKVSADELSGKLKRGKKAAMEKEMVMYVRALFGLSVLMSFPDQ